MMTFHQVCEAIRQEMSVGLPDGRTGVIAEFRDYDWRNFQVTVTLEDGEKLTVHQYGEIKPANPDAFPDPFAALKISIKAEILTKLGLNDDTQNPE